MVALLAWLAIAGAGGLTSQDILARVAETTARRHAVAWSGVRHYTVRNLRFGKDAALTVRMTARPGEGKYFTITERSGNERMIGVVEKLIESEAEASRPSQHGRHTIGPANYEAQLRGSEVVAGRDCHVLVLTPRSKNKYLIYGTVWVDKKTYGIVKLDGTTAASVSMWVGSPHVMEEFAEVHGVWLPMHTKSVSSTWVLGDSVLEIRYSDYVV